MRALLDRVTDWLNLVVVAAVIMVLPVWGLLTITPMTAGWLGCGFFSGLLAAYLIVGFTVMGMDTYAELIMPLSILTCVASVSFSVYCLTVLLWRGAGIEITVHSQ